ncbi:MAG: tetratricopeptide repeat protein, partial [Candidatus Thiodiazotropha endolucinida]|nr:tetratricopeptide repeat protein [Candidatus Thiodiazotropha taylori]MCW4312040.1 tetratricopeptide repeat protein [Candidatus Thiodiazotropha taylori]
MAVLIIVLGFGLKAFEIHQASQPTVDVNSIVEGYAASQRLLGQQEAELADTKEQLTAAVTELARLRDADNAPPGIEKALELLEQGNADKAEAIFQNIATKREKDIKEAAAAYRHLGALAFLTETQKAITAYRRSTELEPDNPKGWNQLGVLLYRTGQIDEAFAAYRRVETLGKENADKISLAVPYTNLGLLYWTRGELDQAEAMYKKSLAIEEALGRQEGMAKNYTNLGILYRTRGELDQAEAMYKKSLVINEALGRQEGMASNYGNLGILYQTRGEFDQAEAMYKKSLAIEEALGRQEGMASNYTNLGLLYRTRGELDQAEAMYKKSLVINEALGRQEGMAKNYT